MVSAFCKRFFTTIQIYSTNFCSSLSRTSLETARLLRRGGYARRKNMGGVSNYGFFIHIDK
ncbi:hypothetical protein C4579_00815 [Candidatus Microgenomates bacterium]|nr:MAG: hypothetical protein C4579_00815 [Candidatus Microgenomates bacterium]